MRRFKLISGSLLTLLFLLQSLFAGEKVQVRAVRMSQAVTIDGKLSESEWKDQNAVSQFLQLEPQEGAPGSEKTLVDVLYDDEAIYIGARMLDSEPQLIEARLSRRDVDITSDAFTVYMDPYYDRRTGYYFSVNAAGTQYDGTLLNDSWNDNAWDGVWESAVQIDENGWSAEIKIPFSQLRFQKKQEQIWGINFKRTIARKNEYSYVTYTPKNESGFVSRFVDLVGLQNVSPPRRLEIVPYMKSQAEYSPSEPGNPFFDGSDFDPGIGMDMKVGIGTNLTVDATMNPDFGQVEVDPAVVNLSDVETFFQEKRPFFVEGSSIFEFGTGGVSNYWGFNWSNPLIFYSRRIGRAPEGSLPDYDFSNVPDAVPIIGAAKLTGKIGNGFNVGTLHAFTSRETADLSISGLTSELEVEPFSYYDVSRGQKEFHEGRQGIGMIATYVNRMFQDDRLRTDINSSALVIGADGWSFLDDQKAWVIGAWSAFSQVNGTSERITDLQENSQHYFQRPDADYVEVDRSATSLSGYAGRVVLNKQKGNVFFNSAFGLISPGFDCNDVGFLWRSDQINTHVGGGYKWPDPHSFYRYAEVGFAAFRSLDYNWNTTWGGLYHFGFIEFKNYYKLDYSLAWNPEETVSNTRTRGGPQTLTPTGYEANVFLQTDGRKRWVYGGGGNLYEGESNHFRAVNASVEWKPKSNVSVSVKPSYETFRTPAQYIDTFEDAFATETFGSRYVFGELKQKTFLADIRLNWTFTPKLSLQLYGQPLISSGDYDRFNYLARPGTYHFNLFANPVLVGDQYFADPDGSGPASPLSFSNPDFNFRSLRGNAILRWEYRPGSTVFFVWTQTRTDEETVGDFQFSRSLGKLWKADADNIFLVKFSYYWNP